MNDEGSLLTGNSSCPAFWPLPPCSNCIHGVCECTEGWTGVNNFIRTDGLSCIFSPAIMRGFRSTQLVLDLVWLAVLVFKLFPVIQSVACPPRISPFTDATIPASESRGAAPEKGVRKITGGSLPSEAGTHKASMAKTNVGGPLNDDSIPATSSRICKSFKKISSNRLVRISITAIVVVIFQLVTITIDEGVDYNFLRFKSLPAKPLITWGITWVLYMYIVIEYIYHWYALSWGSLNFFVIKSGQPLPPHLRKVRSVMRMLYCIFILSFIALIGVAVTPKSSLHIASSLLATWGGLSAVCILGIGASSYVALDNLYKLTKLWITKNETSTATAVSKQKIKDMKALKASSYFMTVVCSMNICPSLAVQYIMLTFPGAIIVLPYFIYVTTFLSTSAAILGFALIKIPLSR